MSQDDEIEFDSPIEDEIEDTYDKLVSNDLSESRTTEHLRPLGYLVVGGDDDALALVPRRDQLEHQLRRINAHAVIPQLVDDQ